MQITEITVAGLPDFVAGNLWRNLSPKPITFLRATAQSKNPRANPEDIALIIAHENNTLLGLVGLLPDFIHGDSTEPASSNSCWWVDPGKGKHLAIPLFLKAFSVCNQRMFMTDCTPHTQRILEKTNRFDFPETVPGIRGFLKFNLHEVVPAKFPALRKLKFLLKLSDQILNFLLIPFQKIPHSKIRNNSPKLEYLTGLNTELNKFIETHSGNEFTRRSATELEWIIQHPWIKQDDKKSITPLDYPFSHLVKSFNQYLVKIDDANQLIGLLFISVRDGHLKVPYAYFEDHAAPPIVKAIYYETVRQKAVTLTVFSPKLVQQMNSVSHPFLFKKRVRRLIAIPKELSDLYQKYPEIQDGDGDVVFT